MPMLEGRVDAVIGVDTHRDRHAAASPRARASARSAAASLVEYPRRDLHERIVLLGRRRGMASLPSRQTASLSSATLDAPRPADRLQGHARSKGRTMRHRQPGLNADEHLEMRSRRCSWDGTGPAPHTT
jgi:hypothetical protein